MRTFLTTALAGIALAGAAAATPASAHDNEYVFDLVASAGVRQCLANAGGKVRIEPGENAEQMTIRVGGLPAETAFDVFIIQVPNFPFGLSWYQGDISTNKHGEGRARFAGRFNIETFIVAPDVAPAPVVHTSPIADAPSNPQTAPVHTYHIGIWFNSPEDARKAGCPPAVTPFNGEHNAGVQVLNSSNFPDDKGPLSYITP